MGQVSSIGSSVWRVLSYYSWRSDLIGCEGRLLLRRNAA
jgi:hypothetical protein